jgi:hypothetical protein
MTKGCTICGSDLHNRSACPLSPRDGEVTCITRTHISMTKQGPGRCAASSRPGWFPSPTWRRQCSRFTEAKPEAVAHRVAQHRAIGGRV